MQNKQDFQIVGELDVTPLSFVPEPVPAGANWWKRFKVRLGNFCARRFGRKRWRVNKRILLYMHGMKFTLEPGYETDFASLPRFLEWLCPADAVFGYGPLFHDQWYRTGQLGKWLSDALFKEVLIVADQQSGYTATKMFLGVHWFGGSAWRGHRAKESHAV